MSAVPTPEDDTPKPPGEAFIRHRWIKPDDIEWAQDSDKILLEHGAVKGSRVYSERHHARWRARKLIKLMVDLRIHERWQLKEHVNRESGGYVWHIEYLGRRGNG